jgi:hypothetical protein
LAGKDFIPKNLYIDIMIMIKNVLFCVCKAKVDDPDGEFWIILLATDRLKELFRILRTMVSNDANLDILQLVCHLQELQKYLIFWPNTHSGTRHPDASNCPASHKTQMRFPREQTTLNLHHGGGMSRSRMFLCKPHGSMDATLWRRIMESLSIYYRNSLKTQMSIFFAPFGTLVFDVPLADDDIDESLEYATPSVCGANTDATPNSGVDDAEVHVEVKDALGELSTPPDSSDALQCWVVESQILINGKLKSKAHLLADFAKYRKYSGSTDCLHHVQDIG